MYKLFIQFADGSTFNKQFTEVGLKSILRKRKAFKGIVKWATVTTPSGCNKDVTKYVF